MRQIDRKRIAAERASALIQGEGFLRLPEVLALIPVCASVWWEGCRSGRFPKGIKIGPRCTAWRASAIRQLLDQLEQRQPDNGAA